MNVRRIPFLQTKVFAKCIFYSFKFNGMNLDNVYHAIAVWVINYGPKVVSGIIILLIGLWLIRVFGRWSQNRMHKKEGDLTLQPFFMSLLLISLRLLLVFVVIEIWGIHLTIFAALVASFGVAAGLALSGTLQNFASGVLILLLKPFIVGENIIAQGLEGEVTAIQIFYTTVRTFDNRTVIIPNSTLSNEVIINISREGVRRLDILQKFSYNVDERQVKAVVNKT